MDKQTAENTKSHHLLSRGRCPVQPTHSGCCGRANIQVVRGLTSSPNPRGACSLAPEFTYIPLAHGVYVAALSSDGHCHLQAQPLWGLTSHGHPDLSIHKSLPPCVQRRNKGHLDGERGLALQQQLHHATTMALSLLARHRCQSPSQVSFPGSGSGHPDSIVYWSSSAHKETDVLSLAWTCPHLGLGGCGGQCLLWPGVVMVLAAPTKNLGKGVWSHCTWDLFWPGSTRTTSSLLVGNVF